MGSRDFEPSCAPRSPEVTPCVASCTEARNGTRWNGNAEDHELGAIRADVEWPGAHEDAPILGRFDVGQDLHGRGTPRRYRERGTHRRARRDRVASGSANAQRVLELNQKHWYIENRLHHRRDVTLGEDASQVRTKGAPAVLAALNGGFLALMDFIGVKNVAKQMRHFCAQPQEALQLLLGKLSRENG